MVSQNILLALRLANVAHWATSFIRYMHSNQVARIVVSYIFFLWERSGSVVECLTLDRRTAGSSLTGVAALCP